MDSELKKIWGFHALFDCAACDIERVKSKANVRDFLAEMVREIDMVPFGAPYIERFATHDIDKSGISFFQMIETSNISGHLCEANGDAYIDIFSCKEYDTRLAQEIIEKYFGPAKVTLRFITRTALFRVHFARVLGPGGRETQKDGVLRTRHRRARGRLSRPRP